VVLGVLVASVYSIAARRLAGRDSALTVTAYQFLAATVVIEPVAVAAGLLHGSGLARAGLDHLGAALGSGVFGTAAAYLLFNHGIARVPAGRAAIVLNLIPVFGTGAAIVGLGERLSPVEAVGGLLIVAGIIAAAAGPRRREVTWRGP
jgi:drug/metabolite transporter (DMT)-like permease